MNRTFVALLCLSAVACIANCITPDCPDEVLADRLKFSLSSYANQALLVPQRCQYLARRAYAGIPFGAPRVVRTTYYVCIDGFEPLLLGSVRGRPVYICEEDGEVVPNETTDDEDEPQVPVEIINVLPTQDSSSDASSPITPERRPTTPVPTTAEPLVATEADNDLNECPRTGNLNTRNFLPSSLELIEQKPCYIRTRVQGSQVSNRESFFWDCKDGYTREHVRREMYRCVQA